MTGRYSKFLRLINLSGDLLLLNLAYIIAFYLKLGSEYGFDMPRPYFSLLLYFNFIWLLISFISENYELSRFDRYLRIFRKMIQAIIIHLFFVTLAFFFIKTVYFSRLHLIYTYGIFGLGLLSWRILIVWMLRNYRKMGYNYRRFIIAGQGMLGETLLQHFSSHPEYGYQFEGYFDDQTQGKNVLGKIGEIEKYIRENNIDEIYLSLPDLDRKYLKEIIRFGDNNLIRVKFIPDFREFGLQALKIENYGVVPVILNRKEPLEDILNRFLKRVFDVGFSAIVMITCLSWLIPIIALLIKLTSKGPIFFMQKRSGKDGKDFWCYKFRTMHVNADSNTVQASRGDKRITKIGQLLRKTNMDELPQFVNVLRGDMSVVGPRPHMLKHTEYYSEMVDKYMVRHFVKPGITGLAQVKGFRGETKDIRSMINRIRMDIFYVENWSFLLDIKIIFLTIFNMIRGDKHAF